MIWNFYFGKINENESLLYLDPFDTDFHKLLHHYKTIYVKEIYFDFQNNCKDREFMGIEFIEYIAQRKKIEEFEVTLNKTLKITNIWWDDILIQGPEKEIIRFLEVIPENERFKSMSEIKELMHIKNEYITSHKNLITKKHIRTDVFLSFIKNPDRYPDKELKVIYYNS